MKKITEPGASDDELYKAFLNGENNATTALDELMLRYGNSLTLFVNGYLHNMQDAEDMMIEAFARIAVKKPAIRKGGFKAYLYKTARNLATRHHMLSKRIETFSLDDMEEELSDPRSPEDHALRAEHGRALKLCLERIDPRLREALWLVYVEDLSYEAAAGIMGVSRKRIDKLLQTAKERMRVELAGETGWKG